ncbi:MGDG synthase family glycosyltransferase [Neobacillus kokaensis]|uniref:Glycosyltransferase YkoN n=1 Tax=Neobacillus kokaensis TaxID=2759023 RepID=A0ABQ3N6K1_9BACI|nr:galactosyldiacylglycerol synthase [Neobacillus kokaensis]GHI00353.1 putative glycosyltransferase YkoN [Neobacillus kokaensis]
MKKILFLPFLQMRSGHHQVAEALMDIVKKANEINVKKIDLLSYANPQLEKMITSGYLKWIRFAPETYDLAYKKFFYASSPHEHSFKWYHYFFLKKMEQLLKEEKPDLIVCTHGFPSYLLSQLKRKRKCDVPVMNVYTDFFINNFWGRKEIDYHLLPSQDVKEEFSKKYHIPEQRMIVTGIPVHQEITKNIKQKKRGSRHKILISGGNNGLGGIVKLLEKSKLSSQSDFYVLCGNNQKLYDDILSWNVDHIKPLSYISSRAEMNQLYEEMDAIVTKPGGVTISEVLQKRLPVFVQSVLPGQEEINLQYLTDKGLVFKLKRKNSFEQDLLSFLRDPTKMNEWEQSIDAYQKGIEIEGSMKIAEIMNGILEHKSLKPASLSEQSKVYRLARA